MGLCRLAWNSRIHMYFARKRVTENVQLSFAILCILLDETGVSVFAEHWLAICRVGPFGRSVFRTLFVIGNERWHVEFISFSTNVGGMIDRARRVVSVVFRQRVDYEWIVICR